MKCFHNSLRLRVSVTPCELNRNFGNWQKCIFLLAACCGVLAAHATEYFVDSVGGNDANDGKSAKTAWRSLERVNGATLVGGDVVRFRKGGLWRGTLVPHSGTKGNPVTYTSYGDGVKPILQRSLDFSGESDWVADKPGLWATCRERPIELDVGQIIIDHGKRWGYKKWNNPAWKVPKNKQKEWAHRQWIEDDLDFWYDATNRRVVVKFPVNPGKAFASIELALTKSIIDESHRHDVTYDGLWLRYGGAHGIGGCSTANIVVRNCDISWMGGGQLGWSKKPDGTIVGPVRYGNGVEFWCNCRDNLVENCRVWEIYDAGLTNQGRKSRHSNIVWRNNVLWNCENSFECWNDGPMSNVTFERNTCVDAGYGWSHDQRHNRNACHLLFYNHQVTATNIVIRNNVFCRSRDWIVRFGLDLRYGLTQDRNLVYTEEGLPVLFWVVPGQKVRKLPWSGYVEMGFDANGIFAEPKFIDPAKRNYRLAPDSPGRDLFGK